MSMFMSRGLCPIRPFVLVQEYTYNDGIRSSILGVIIL